MGQRFVFDGKQGTLLQFVPTHLGICGAMLMDDGSVELVHVARIKLAEPETH